MSEIGQEIEAIEHCFCDLIVLVEYYETAFGNGWTWSLWQETAFEHKLIWQDDIDYKDCNEAYAAAIDEMIFYLDRDEFIDVRLLED